MTRFLLDTNAVYNLLTVPERFDPRLLSQLTEPAAERWVSVAVPFELVIKASLGKLALPPDMVPFASAFAMHLDLLKARLLPVELAHFEVLMDLPFHHRDPFDRLMIAQALSGNMTLVSSDHAFTAYQGLKTIGL